MPSLAQRAQSIADMYQPPLVGRPSDIASQSTVQQFLEAVGEGNYIETAAKLAGITKQSVYEWIKRGEAGETPFDMFADAVKEAEARAEAKMLANVRAASALPQFWAAGMTVLERRHPERWGKRAEENNAPKVLVQVGGGGHVQVNIGLSPTNVNELACANPSQVEMLSPINRDYVNQPHALSESVPAQDRAQSILNPAQALPGDPTGGVGGPQRPRRHLLAKGRAGRGIKKKGSTSRQDGSGGAIG